MSKPKKTKNVAFINFALGMAGRIHLSKVKKASKNCKKASETTLRGILEYAKDTEWGKAHNFSEILAASTPEELYSRWQKNVPPQDYEDLRPFVERHKNGEENVLFPGKPKMYATTSGTTNTPKWIPITNEYYDNVYSKMTNIWLYTFLMHRPKCFEGPAISIVGKAIYTINGETYSSNLIASHNVEKDESLIYILRIVLVILIIILFLIVIIYIFIKIHRINKLKEATK